ncbi:MAG: TldD/PmbA family protein, partial [Symploca sp. SIO2G7]|nr:TldD/PmbA family protein [Symploca sp. SIO2G7]
MTKIKELATQAEEIAKKLGIKKFDVYGSSVDETSVQVDQGEPKQVKASNRSSVTVRVWNDNQKVGVTSTTDMDPIGMELALKTAYEASSFGVTEHAPDFSPEATTSIPEVPQKQVPQAPVAKLLETLLGAEKQLINAHPAITGVPYNRLSQREIERFYLNSEGALRHE